MLLIAWCSKSRHFFIAGLVPLFPTFALIAHAMVGSERGPAALRQTALFGLCALLPYAVYLLVVFWLSLRLGLGDLFGVQPAVQPCSEQHHRGYLRVGGSGRGTLPPGFRNHGAA